MESGQSSIFQLSSRRFRDRRADGFEQKRLFTILIIRGISNGFSRLNGPRRFLTGTCHYHLKRQSFIEASTMRKKVLMTGCLQQLQLE